MHPAFEDAPGNAAVSPSATCFPFGIGDLPPVHGRPDDRARHAAFRGSPATALTMRDEIRRLGPEDAADWRARRLEALERHPEAFGASLEEERALPLEAWAGRLEHAVVFGAGRGPQLLGCAGLFVERTRKKRHKAVLFGVYVRVEARGQGLGRALVGRVVEAARERATQLHTAVVTANLGARRLYRELGFVAYGVEPRALEVDGRYLDEELLVLTLEGAPLDAAEHAR